MVLEMPSKVITNLKFLIRGLRPIHLFKRVIKAHKLRVSIVSDSYLYRSACLL